MRTSAPRRLASVRTAKPPSLGAKLALTLAATASTLVLLEIALAGYHLLRSLGAGPPLHVALDAPVLYGLNPKHPEVSAQGLRDDEVAMPKPEGVLRVLLLGDSVAYGPRVRRQDTFPERLEELLAARYGAVEVINAGVSGYGPYNELHDYLSRGRRLDPDLVLVAFCFNDLANPRLHWSYTGEQLRHVPEEAIPNPDYDRLHALPRLAERRRREASWLRRSRLLTALEWRLKELRQRARLRSAGDATLPRFITSEDSLGIDALLDEGRPEWRWLWSIYERLQRAVEADGARFAVVAFPLAYQLDPSYPYVPQSILAAGCARRSIPMLDLLEAFRGRDARQLYLLDRGDGYDVWHLTEAGHRLAAAEIFRFLEERSFLPGLDKARLAAGTMARERRPPCSTTRSRWRFALRSGRSRPT